MTRVMGIVNVTPDSFSDGGHWLDPALAVARARRLVDEGADLIDIGGESTRPGAVPVDESTELARTIPVIEELTGTVGEVEISIDTTKPTVARAAVAAGATIINDVSASLEAVAAETGAGWIAMHALGPSATMQDDPVYDDVVDDICAFLAAAAARGRAAGVTRLWVDPFACVRQPFVALLFAPPYVLKLRTRQDRSDPALFREEGIDEPLARPRSPETTEVRHGL